MFKENIKIIVRLLYKIQPNIDFHLRKYNGKTIKSKNKCKPKY